jgi:hypothetical protein
VVIRGWQQARIGILMLNLKNKSIWIVGEKTKT